MRRTAIGVGAAASLGAAGSTPAAAVDVDWKELGKIAATTVVGGPAALGAIAYGRLIDGPDEEAVGDSLEWQSAVNEYTRAREDELLLNETLASLKRDVQLVGNKAREDAIFAVFETANNGGTTTEATTAAENAIDNAYSVVEESVLRSWSIRANRANAIYNSFSPSYDSTNSGITDQYFLLCYSGTTQDFSTQGSYSMYLKFGKTSTYTLKNGNTIDYTHGQNTTMNTTGVRAYDPVTYESNVNNFVNNNLDKFMDTVVMMEPDPANFSTRDDPLGTDYGDVMLINTRPWGEMITDINTRHSNLTSEVSSIVSTYFDPAANGEIDLTDALGPSYLTETAKNAADFEEASMALRGMGMSMSEQKVVVEFSKDGDTYTLEGRLGASERNPNDLPVGSQIDPSQVSGSIYGAFNVMDSNGEQTGDVFEITNPFTIVEAEGASSVSFKNRELVESDTTLTNEEIVQIFKDNQKENEKAKQQVYRTATTTTTTGGGGGFLDGGLGDVRTLGIVAGGAALAALLFGNN